MARFVSQGVLAVLGLPILHLKKVRFSVNTNRELVTGMSPTGTAIGYADGTKEIDLDIDVYVPETGDIPWTEITGGVVSIFDRGGTISQTFQGVFVVSVDTDLDQKGPATRSIKAKALNMIGSL